MAIPNPFRRLFPGLSRPGVRDAQVTEEIRFHIDAATERYRERGLSPEEARRAALLDFGGVDKAREEARDERRFSALADFARDARLAIRGFRRRPAYAATVIVTIALAVGAASAIFGALWAVVVKPLPYAADDRLVLFEQTTKSNRESLGLSPLEIADFRNASRAIDGLAEYHNMSFTLLGHGEPRRVRTGVVSDSYFHVLGVRPILGRDFVAADDTANSSAVLLLGYRFWQREFGADPTIIGRHFTMNDHDHTVVGVLPPLPGWPNENDVYMPVHACPFRAMPMWADDRTARGLVAVARLRDGFDLAAAHSDLATIEGRLATSYPSAYVSGEALVPRLVPLRDAISVGARPTLWLLVAAAAFVLVLVCANLVNLGLAQLARRDAELAVRAALGASRARIVRQLATEGLLLALAGGVVGLVLAVASRGLLAGFLGRLTPRAADIRLDPVVLLTHFAIVVAIGLVVSIVPALTRKGEPSAALRSDGPTASAAKRHQKVRDVLVVLQVAASFVLLIGAGLLLRSLWNLERVPAGYEHPEVLTMHIPLNWTKYQADDSRRGFHNRLVARVRELPGVLSAALADSYPLNSNQPWNRRVAVGDTPPNPSEPGPTADFRSVSPDYFATIGVKVVAGRGFSEADHDDKNVAAIVNQAFARVLFPTSDPLGKRVIFGHGTSTFTIVGVVGDVRQRALEEEPRPELFVPMAANPGGDFRLLVRANAPAGLEASLRAIVRDLDPDQPVTEVVTLAAARAESLAAPRTTATLLAIAGCLALLIAAAGLAGLLAYTLAQRRRELGIRLALGASRTDIARLVLGRTGRLVAIGVVIGIVASAALTRGLSSLLFGLATTDPGTYVAVATVLVAASLTAALPALVRALTTAPSLVLRAG